VSQENVEVLRSLAEGWNRGDRTDTSAFHPDVEWLPIRAATEGAYRGIAGIKRFIADTEESFDKFELRQDLRDLGERVLAWGTVHVRARQSGIETDIPTGGIFEFCDGKIVRWRDFGSKQAALKAVGLEE
jgi:limonene-1,2-epoxide hydrolase